MDEDNFLELLETYMDMVEKQDEIICRLGKIAKRLAEDRMLLANDMRHSEWPEGDPDVRYGQDVEIIKEVAGQYKGLKAELGP